MRAEAKMTAGLACDGIAEFCGVSWRVRFPTDRGEASYRDDFLADMVKSYDFWSEAFIKVAADGITDFSVKLRDSVSFGKNRNAKRPCNEPALRRVFYHKD